jgi:hypothetical protein
MIEMDHDRDGRNYNPLMVAQQFHRSSDFFNCKRQHGHCERRAFSHKNMIEAQICNIRDRMPHEDSFTIVTLSNISNIIPPLTKTGCEDLEDGQRKIDCEFDVQKHNQNRRVRGCRIGHCSSTLLHYLDAVEVDTSRSSKGGDNFD